MPPKGSSQSAETRAKISAAKKGIPLKPEQIAAMSARMVGQRLGPRPWMRKADAGYTALHARVYKARGRAAEQICKCGDPARHWANLTGNYADVMDYEAMCRRCHARYDAERSGGTIV